MNFFEDVLVDLASEGIFVLIQKIGILIKWLVYLGQKPISEIKTENWNFRIGFLATSLIVGLIIYFVN